MAPKTREPLEKRLLDRTYLYAGVTHLPGVRMVPAGLRGGTPVGAGAGAGLSDAEAAFVALLDDGALAAYLATKGVAAPAGATRADLLALVGVGGGSAPAPSAAAAPAFVRAEREARPGEAAQFAATVVRDVAGGGDVVVDTRPPADPAGGDTGATDDESASEYEAKDKPVLEAEAKRRGLTVTGTGKRGVVLKRDLVAALLAADAAGA